MVKYFYKIFKDRQSGAYFVSERREDLKIPKVINKMFTKRQAELYIKTKKKFR